MKAAVATSFTHPLETLEVPVPSPRAGEVLVRVEASGLCVLAGSVPARLVFEF